MVQQETPLNPSWLLLLRNLAVAAGCGVGAYFLVQTSEIVLIILGVCMLITAPVVVAIPLFMGLPGRGACPSCGGTLETGTASDSNLLCRGCNGYFDAGQGKLKPADPQRVVPEPTFAAPTPWHDLTNVVFPTIAFFSRGQDPRHADDERRRHAGNGGTLARGLLGVRRRRGAL